MKLKHYFITFKTNKGTKTISIKAFCSVQALREIIFSQISDKEEIIDISFSQKI